MFVLPLGSQGELSHCIGLQARFLLSCSNGEKTEDVHSLLMFSSDSCHADLTFRLENNDPKTVF